MNPVQVVEAARPEVSPLSEVERRQIRERLFDAAMRSQNQTSTVELASPNNRMGNAVRMLALGALALTAIGGLAYSASRETPGSRPDASSNTDIGQTTTSAPTRNSIVQAPRPTVGPTTTLPPVPGSDDTPLLFPPERNRLDELKVTRQALGGSALLLRAPDLSTISLREMDGIPPVQPDPDEPPPTDDSGVPVTTAAPRPFTNVEVGPPTESTPGQYTIVVPCGTVDVIDNAGFAPFRPEMSALFESIRLDSGAIEIDLPEGWTAISGGPLTDEFIFGLPVQVGDREVTITLAQYPGGSLATAGYDDLQYLPTTFNGQQSWIHRDVENPAAFDVISMIGSTAIRASASDISLRDLEVVLAGLTTGDADEWASRFGALPVTSDPDIRTCADQPVFDLI